MKLANEFTKGLYRENAVFRLVIGLCPTLAITTTVINAIGMGIAVIAVLVCTNLFISLIRNLVPANIRLPIFLVVIATFVSIVDMLMAAYQPALSKSLGIFVPLIVVNCVILARAEAFASKNSALYSVVDGLGMGIGYTMSLLIIGAIREFFGNGSIAKIALLPHTYQPVLVMILAPGAFLTLGYVLGVFNWLDSMKKRS